MLHSVCQIWWRWVRAGCALLGSAARARTQRAPSATKFGTQNGAQRPPVWCAQGLHFFMCCCFSFYIHLPFHARPRPLQAATGLQRC